MIDPDEQKTPESEPPGQQTTLEINFGKLKEMSALGVRRAAAFLGIGLNSTNTLEGLSLALTDQSMWRFFSEPEPEATIKEAVSEFRIWITGNALRELDAHFSLFLDEVWFTLEFAKLHGTKVPTDHTIKGIAHDTNVASKFEKVLGSLGKKDDDGGKLRSLSLARNCLSHSHGVVTNRHANSEGSLEIRWLGLESRLQQGEDYVVIGPKIDGMGVQAPDPSKEARLVVVVVERRKTFAVGERITLEPIDLHEICFNYLQLTDKILEPLQGFLTDCGIAKPEPIIA